VDLATRQQLVAGTSTRSDAIAALGAPHGQITFPSMPLLRQFGSMPEIEAPPGAVSALVHDTFSYRTEHPLDVLDIEQILVFLAEADVVLAVNCLDGQVLG